MRCTLQLVGSHKSFLKVRKCLFLSRNQCCAHDVQGFCGAGVPAPVENAGVQLVSSDLQLKPGRHAKASPLGTLTGTCPPTYMLATAWINLFRVQATLPLGMGNEWECPLPGDRSPAARTISSKARQRVPDMLAAVSQAISKSTGLQQ